MGKKKGRAINLKNKYQICGAVTKIFIERKNGDIIETLIDTDDLPLVSSYKNTWVAQHYKSRDVFYVSQYAGKNENKERCVPYRLHRIITNCPENLVVDHVNHNTLDNRKSNLNIVTSRENSQNTVRRKNRSTFRGVRKTTCGYDVSFMINGEHKFLGSYLLKKHAISARIRAEIKYWNYRSSIKKWYRTLKGRYLLKNQNEYRLMVEKKNILSKLCGASTIQNTFGVSRQRIEQYRRDGMPFHKVGGRYFYELDKCIQWVQSNISKSIKSTNNIAINAIDRKEKYITITRSEYESLLQKISVLEERLNKVS
jgi:hypothetical protein